MDIDSALLRTWLVVAEEGHVGRAAMRLGVSQQAVSQRLTTLSTHLGTPIFERSGRGIRLTELGAELLPRCRRVVDDIDRLHSQAHPGSERVRVDVLDEHLSVLRFVIDELRDQPDLQGTPTGPGAPSTPDPSGSTTRPGAPAGDARPAGVEVVMRGESDSIPAWLRTGKADLCLGRAGPVGVPWPEDLDRGEPLLEPLMLVVGSEHPWRERAAVPMAELGQARLWFPTVGAPPEWRDLLIELGREFGADIDHTGSTMGLTQFLADLAHGGTVASFWGASMELPPPPLRLIALVDPVPVFPWFPVWRHGRSDAVRRLAEAIVRRARRATPEPHPDEAWLPASDRALLT